MHRRPAITPAIVRLVRDGAAAPRRSYRPLVAGPAILARGREPGAPWLVDLACDAGLLPRAPRAPHVLAREVARRREQGLTCRIALALACPHDAAPGTTPPPARAFGALRGAEFYGWALLYQPPGMRGRAMVDPDDRFTDLPACFELPLELLDRAAHLEAHGIRTRPLAVVTRPEDFTIDGAGLSRNRFFPDAVFRRLHWPDAAAP